MNWWFDIGLIFLGIVAGIINTLAGGGSNLTIPALIYIGMPANIANASNRVGVLMQGIVGTWAFHKSGRLETSDLSWILAPTLIGGLIGALFASYLPSEYLKYILLITMISMALIMLLRSNTVFPPVGAPIKKVSDSKSGLFWLSLSGLYGGFIQAGVGFVLLIALTGSLNYDIVRANAIKMVCTTSFTIVAVIVFILRDQVMWQPAIALAIGSMIGAKIGVKIAINISQKAMKWTLFIMTLVACIAALLKT